MTTIRSTTRARWILGGVVAALAVLATACPPQPAPGGGGGGPTLPTLPPPPVEDELLRADVFSGLSQPTNVEFAPDGRVFVAEKSGIIKTFDSVADPTPTIAADLTAPVRSIADHGLLGMTLDPAYPTRPYLYVQYAWDITGLWGDACASDYALNGCVTGGRISRLTLDENGVMVGAAHTIVEDKLCFQFTSHGVGDLQFLDDGTLLASSGDGASFAGTDYGQHGGTPPPFRPPVPNLTPRNPCGDPPGGVGGPMSPTTGEGGAFRSQDLLTSGDPLGWTGALVRIDPDTGEAPADNPLVGDGDPDNDHMIAHGLRNPYRFAVRPGTDEVFIADVGMVDYEEINKITVGQDEALNFGWPCYEGPVANFRYGALNNVMCTELIDAPDAPSVRTDPWFSYGHSGGASISGIEFIPPGKYPAEYDGNVLFTDYVKGELYTLAIGADGSPDPAGPRTVGKSGIPVDLTAGPDGYIYMVDYVAGTVERLVHKDLAPVARLEASATSGALPLAVTLDASASTGPADAELIFEWDLDGDGQFDDATGPIQDVTFTEALTQQISVRVTVEGLASSIASTTIYAGNTPPEVEIEVTSDLPWSANDIIDFEITATDAEDGVLPQSAISWEVQINHCYDPTDCHIHPFTGASGTSVGSVSGPSHGFPSYLSILATAVDSRGQVTTVTERLDPATVDIEVTSNPPGATVSLGESTKVTPFTETVIRNDTISITLPVPQTLDGVPHVFSNWGHGAPQSHQYQATAEDSSIELNMVPSAP